MDPFDPHPSTHPDIKGFRDFQKVGFSRVFLKTQLLFVNHIIHFFFHCSQKGPKMAKLRTPEIDHQKTP